MNRANTHARERVGAEGKLTFLMAGLFMAQSGARGGAKSRWSRAIAIVAAVVIAAPLLSAYSLTVAPAETAVAANPGDFTAGNIIADSVFFDPALMSATQVQQFLSSQVTDCRSGYTCLKDFRETTTSRAADSYCRAYTGVANQSSADIIWNVGQACGINPQVLLVLLQKEQSLVTDTWPTPSQYRIATGYGCPDTAPCDAQFYGFFNQVYKAARQFRVYQTWPEDFNFRPGPAAIGFNPNGSCGASTVYIENQATAGLYNYTPYQPNAAAIGNLYGTGDGCSSYGNRNFWRLFTDWFGDPQGGSLVRSPTSTQVFLITDTAKYTVSSGALYNSLLALGAARIVSQQYLDRVPSKGEASNLLRDSSSGAIYLASFGAKNQFGSCALVAEWGFGASCGQYINVTAAQLQRFTTGAAVTQFARSTSTNMIYYVDDGVKRGIHSWSQVVEIAAGGSTAYADYPQATLDRVTSGPDYLPAGTVVRTASDPQLYLASGAAGAIPITTGNILSAYGLGSRIVTISAASRAAMTVAPAPLGIAIACGTDVFIAGGGSVYKVPSSGGLATTPVDPTSCAGLPRFTWDVTGGIFLRNPSTGEIFVISNGKKRFVSTTAELYSLNGSFPLVTIPASAETLASIPTSTVVLPVATLVKAPSNPAIYLIDGASTRVSIPSFALAAEFGITGYSTVTDSALNGYAASPSALSIAVTCGGVSYIAGAGKLWQVPATHGLPTTTLDAATCAALAKSTQVTTGAVFMLQKSTGAIYYITGGEKVYMTSGADITAVNGANPAVYIPSTDATVSAIPTRAVVAPPASITVAKLVKTATGPTIYFIDGTSRKLSLPSFGLAAEFGVTGYSVVTDAALSPYTAAGALTFTVVCGTQNYVAGGGSLWAVPSASGFAATTFDPTTCAALTVSPTVVTGATFLRLPGGEIYYLNAGTKQFVTSMARVNALNGANPLVLIPSTTAVTNAIPSGPTLN